MNDQAKVQSIVESARAKLTSDASLPAPEVAIILGSGLGGLSQQIDVTLEVPASQIDGYPASTVQGHSGNFLRGTLGGIPVIALSGRVHGYEGHPAPILGVAARILCSFAPKALIVTNAAGGIREDLRPGDLMLISDHLNLTARSPLEGPNHEEWGPRFPDMSTVYAAKLRTLVRDQNPDREFKEGVYACMPGPQYETPAEVRMLRGLGADAVGMSTVPEATVASHMRIRVLGISVISNAAAGMNEEPLSHDEVLEATQAAGTELERIVIRLAQELGG